MPTKNKLYILVTYAGALPFIACAIMLYSGIHAVEGIGRVSNITAICALIVVFFIAGLHLGTLLLYRTRTPSTLLIFSNILAVVAWLTLTLVNFTIASTVLITALVYLLGVDYLLQRESFISHHYFNTRLVVTLITSGSLLISASIG